MHKITSVAELRESILQLQIKQAQEGSVLKEQMKATFNDLKPANLIKNTLNDLVTTPDLKGDLLNAAISLSTGYLSKKIMVGSTHNPLKQLLGTLLQVGVTSLVSKNADGIKSVTGFFINKLMSKKDKPA